MVNGAVAKHGVSNERLIVARALPDFVSVIVPITEA